MIDFPDSPALNEMFVHSYGYKYRWDGVKWVAVGSEQIDAVTEYTTVAELITASEATLAPGHYEVPGVVFVRWDGVDFRDSENRVFYLHPAMQPLPVTVAPIVRHYTAVDLLNGEDDGAFLVQWRDKSRKSGSAATRTSGTPSDLTFRKNVPALELKNSGELATALSPAITGPFTIIYAMNIIGPIGSWGAYYAGQAGIEIGENSTTGQLYISGGPSTIGTVKLGRQNFAVRYDGANSKLNHDSNSFNFTHTISSFSRFTIGKNTGFTENMLVYEAMIFDGFLSDTEIADHFARLDEVW